MAQDKIEKTVVLKATRERVWRAITDSGQFGRWFGVQFAGPFAEGAEIQGHIVPTEVDPEVAKLQEPHRGMPFQIHVERIEPMRLFAFRWRPFAVDPNHDYSDEPMTLVSFELADAEGGVLLTISEVGFAGLPAERRDEALRANDGGWAHQTVLLTKFLALPSS